MGTQSCEVEVTLTIRVVKFGGGGGVECDIQIFSFSLWFDSDN